MKQFGINKVIPGSVFFEKLLVVQEVIARKYPIEATFPFKFFFSFFINHPLFLTHILLTEVSLIDIFHILRSITFPMCFHTLSIPSIYIILRQQIAKLIICIDSLLVDIILSISFL